ncbi:MAG: NifU family protein, partial [Actinomycetota bacterium]|nr:NifU family protein [Actinomycetota bacterium]
MITLEVDGSPGAVIPILGRIEAQIRAAVPAVAAVRLAGTGAAPQSPEAGDLGGAAQRVLDAEVNPSIAAHREHVTVASADGGWVRVRLEGGCQGLQPGRGHHPAGHRAAAACPAAWPDRRIRRHRSRGRHGPVLLPGETVTTARRVLLLAPARSYRTADFMLAAAKMGLDLTVASDGALPVGPRPAIPVRPGLPEHAAEWIVSRCGPADAVVAADAPMLLLGAA